MATGEAADAAAAEAAASKKDKFAPKCSVEQVLAATYDSQAKVFSHCGVELGKVWLQGELRTGAPAASEWTINDGTGGCSQHELRCGPFLGCKHASVPASCPPALTEEMHAASLVASAFSPLRAVPVVRSPVP